MKTLQLIETSNSYQIVENSIVIAEKRTQTYYKSALVLKPRTEGEKYTVILSNDENLVSNDKNVYGIAYLKAPDATTSNSISQIKKANQKMTTETVDQPVVNEAPAALSPEAQKNSAPVTDETKSTKKGTRSGKSKAEKQAALNPSAPAAPAASTPPAAPAEPEAPKEPGKIEQILALHKAGKTNAEIVAAGFNKTTVSIQVSRYKKTQEAAAAAAAKEKIK